MFDEFVSPAPTSDPSIQHPAWQLPPLHTPPVHGDPSSPFDHVDEDTAGLQTWQALAGLAAPVL